MICMMREKGDLNRVDTIDNAIQITLTLTTILRNSPNQVLHRLHSNTQEITRHWSHSLKPGIHLARIHQTLLAHRRKFVRRETRRIRRREQQPVAFYERGGKCHQLGHVIFHTPSLFLLATNAGAGGIEDYYVELLTSFG